MRKLTFIMILLAPCLFVPFVVKTKNSKTKKSYLVAAPEYAQADQAEQIEPDEKAVEAQSPKKNTAKSSKTKSNSKSSELSKKDAKKSGKKTFAITDTFKDKERHQAGTLGYHKFFTWFYPTLFVLKINDIPVLSFDGKEYTRPNREITLDPNEPITAHFDWEFLHGRKKGWRTTDFKLDPSAQEIVISFDWKDTWQVKIDQAQPIPESDKSSDNKDVEKK